MRVSGSLIPLDRHVGWKKTKSKVRYLEAIPEQLIGVTRSVSI